MKETTPWWIASGILLAAAVVASSNVASTPQSYAERPPGSGWVDRDAPRRIRALAAPIERIAAWPGLGDFLVATAWRESRGNSSAQNASGAKGWFQLFGWTARTDDIGVPASVLRTDEPLQVALAAWYAFRLRPFAYYGQIVDWAALSRGWAYPTLVDDVNLEQQRSRDNLRRFEEAVEHAGLPEDFVHFTAFGPMFTWPGIDAVLRAVGRSRNA
jgi:hypothetical protein